MLTRIIDQIHALGCEIFEITEETINTWEFYLIRHSLDQNRVVETKQFHIKLYRRLNHGADIGIASGIISPTLNDTELNAELSKIYLQAGLTCNPSFSLNHSSLPPIPSLDVDIEAISSPLLKSILEIPETETERINSCELFVSKVQKMYVNSNGVTYRMTYPCSMLEVVINSRENGKEIELYRNYTFGTCVPMLFVNRIKSAFQLGKDRLHAMPTPKLTKSDIILSGESAVSLYEFYVSKMNAEMQYRSLSDWTVGKEIVPDPTGDLISIYAVSHLENSSHDYPVDADGAWIQDRYLIRDNIAMSTWGSKQMSDYIGSSNSSSVYNIIVSGGKVPAEGLHSDEYLELFDFLDLQIDPVGGDILGEIRLGYWHHGGRIIPVSGGSISGNMHDVLASIRFSIETVQYDNYVIPKETLLRNLSITGVE